MLYCHDHINMMLFVIAYLFIYCYAVSTVVSIASICKAQSWQAQAITFPQCS